MDTLQQQDPEDLVARYIERPRPELKDLIMVQYTGLVERIARKFAGLEPVQDLVQVGFIGLLNALSKYNPDAGVKFTTYASHLIAGEIKHYLRDRSQTIRQPAWLQELRHKVNRTSGMLQQTKGTIPTTADIARELGVPESSVQEVINTQDMLRVGSLDTSNNSEDDSSDMDRMEAAEPCVEQSGVEERLVLEKAMSNLRDLERQVLVYFHFDSLSQAEIAKRIGISPNYVSHVMRQAQGKLRRIMMEEETRDEALRSTTPDIDLSIVDRATGAYTEAYLRTRLQEELHRSTSDAGDVALLLIDFRNTDGLRRFYGSEALDSFLADAAEFLRNNVRRLDIVARFGPTGFGIILPYAGQNVGIVRNRVSLKTMQWTPTKTGGAEVVAVHVGEAWAPQSGKSMAALINAAVGSMSPIGV